jgi:hypothetical protein
LEARLGAVRSQIVQRVDKELSEVAAKFTLDVDLAAVLFEGWKKLKELREAGQRSLTEGKEVKVSLVPHDITFTKRPKVEVLLEERPLTTIDCEFKAALSVDCLEAVVRTGALQEIGAGSCTITVSFAMEGVDLAKKKVESRSLLQIPLGSGIRLVEASSKAADPPATPVSRVQEVPVRAQHPTQGRYRG